MDELFGSITAAAVADGAFSPLFFGISWPSFSDEIAGKIENAAGTLTEMARGQFDSAKGVRKLAQLLNDPGVADKFGFLGYPAISKDADEVGMVPVSTLINEVLMPLRETLPGKAPRGRRRAQLRCESRVVDAFHRSAPARGRRARRSRRAQTS